ncbi:unnamed protein product [Rotaria sordida]|uniref:RRM domain-containing protein n=1 Tax=Rotaria sordida TaxID=392033 RepID=A0A813SU97_9BILA|nr:unnamed protein product [Rotaria sordida]CAF0811239.1 unnamed protein product [Rotaria sordida]CAF4012897.1 unnamed protein product [Rotaria sordida]
MKVKPKTTAANATNRISALDRLSKPTPNNNNKRIHQRLSAPTNRTITDARQLLTNRNTPMFDARQLLSRQSSKNLNTSLIIRKDIVQAEEEEEEQDDDDDEQNPEVISSFNNVQLVSRTPNLSFEKKNNNTFVALQNSNSTESISFTKTITNTLFQHENDNRQFQTSNTQLSSSDKKLAISFVKDQYRKRPKSPSPRSLSPPPIIRRLHDASIQTAHSSSLSLSRSPVRSNSHRRHLDEYDDHYEPPIKRNSSRNTTIDKEQQALSTVLKNSSKRTSTNASDNIRTKRNSSIQSNSDARTVLVTNLQSSVTEDDVVELFSEVGHINEIITLSRGCVQVTYSKREYAEEAVAKYHNRLLDGQLIYVSLQQTSSHSTKSSKNSSLSRYSKDNSSSQSINDNEYLKSNSNKIIIDPTFMRQALFNSSNNTTNPVQFQVKL